MRRERELLEVAYKMADRDRRAGEERLKLYDLRREREKLVLDQATALQDIDRRIARCEDWVRVHASMLETDRMEFRRILAGARS